MSAIFVPPALSSHDVEVDGGLRLLSREAAFYLDPRSREFLEHWDNPITGERVDVCHVWNDPVNQEWLEQMPWGPFRVPMTDLGAAVCFNLDIRLAYPSPLPVAAYPDNSADDTYWALELFQFFAAASDLADAALTSVPCQLSWSRVFPWLPWMRMGPRPGGLIFHTRGVKTGYDAVPEQIRTYIAEKRPEFAEPPTAWSAPNETSWTAFKKQA
ncbi:DUF1838 family protein [Janibacter corallicola]|uniref:DUF1838 family protein n=1 Tax=Janibacter corallicola TaxID=415212 RepID=UPI00083310B2|nr:DUF1838 family protein [Janibacter corallicola]